MRLNFNEMREIDESLDRFLGTSRKFSGRAPRFYVDWPKGQIVIIDACGGFLRLLYADEKACASLSEDGIKLQYFK